jgi:hypothetical protein
MKIAAATFFISVFAAALHFVKPHLLLRRGGERDGGARDAVVRVAAAAVRVVEDLAALRAG